MRLSRFLWSLLALVLFCFLLLHSGCKSTLSPLSPLGYGYRAVSMLSKARDATANGIRVYCQEKFNTCEAAHGTDNDPFRACLGGCIKAIPFWHGVMYPVIEAAIQVTLGTLEAAKAKKEKNWNWFKSALPAVCGLVKAVAELKPLLGDKAKQILGYLDLGRSYVCP